MVSSTATPEEVADKAQQLEAQHGRRSGICLYAGAPRQTRECLQCKAGLSLLMSRRRSQPIAFIEDTAVDPKSAGFATLPRDYRRADTTAGATPAWAACISVLTTSKQLSEVDKMIPDAGS